MKIDESFTVKTDANNYELIMSKGTGEINKETGKEIVSVGNWYYSNLESALAGYVKHSLKPLPENIEEVLQKLEEIHNSIKQIGT